MERSSLLVWGGVILAVVVGIGQESEQSWKLRRTGDGDEVQFTLHRFRPGHSMTWSQEVPLSRFRNLSSETLSHSGRTQFEYVTDAGKVICKGSFSFHSGAGSFVFAPNPDFVTELRKLGYDTPRDEQLFEMMMSNVSLDFARTVQDAGLHASTGQLLELRHRGVDAEFLRGLKNSGYDFTASNIIELRNHGVDWDFLHDLKRAGYDLSTSEIVELRMHGIGGDYLSDLRSLGLHPRVPDMVQFRMHGVGADFLADLKAAGYDNLTADQIVQLRMNGVSSDFVIQARELGYSFSPGELVNLQHHGVNGEYLKTLKQSGIRALTAEQIEKLKMHGVD